MRIRTYRVGDLPELYAIQQQAAQVDQTQARSLAEFESWLLGPEQAAETNAFVLSDDDDELNEWGQAGTLEGLEGEIVGFTLLRLLRGPDLYRFRCEGTILPAQRRRNGGRSLLICALNRARIWTADVELEAEELGAMLSFEALLPSTDPASARLARRCELEAAPEPVGPGLVLYQRFDLEA